MTGDVRPPTLLSPVALTGLSWAVMTLIAILPLAFPDRFRLVYLFIERQGTSVEDFTWIAALWQCLMFATFALAATIAGWARPRWRGPDTSPPLDAAARLCFWMNALFVGITLCWLILSVRLAGGIAALALLVQFDSYEARDLLLDNTLFVGMRQLYGALPATGAVAAGLLATRSLTARARAAMWLTLAVNLVLLAVLPIVLSQRLLLVQMLLSSYITLCVVRRRIVGTGLILAGAALFIATWLLREAVTNPDVAGSALQIGAQKLVFYFFNDFLNAFMPFNRDLPRSHGFFSLGFMMEFTQTRDLISAAMAEELGILRAARGGGLWPMFTMPYVDFGPIGGAAFIAGLGVASALVWHRASASVFWAVGYGNVAAALILSVHLMYFSMTDFYVALLVAHVCSRAAAPNRLQEGAADGPRLTHH